jgi:hypothetical protein
MRVSIVLVALSAIAMPLTMHAEPALASGWEIIAQEAGITVSRKDVPGRDLPIFRGTGVVNASAIEILAILSDSPRNPEWMHNCHSARKLKTIDDQSRIIYNRTTAPWPVSDRDVVLQSSATWVPDTATVMVRFKSISSPLQGEVDGVVRMPRLNGFYKLEALSWEKTRVTYQVDADPGGLLPDWLVERVQNDIPLKTLKNLRRQVVRMRGKYPVFMKKWDPRQGGAAPLK